MWEWLCVDEVVGIDSDFDVVVSFDLADQSISSERNSFKTRTVFQAHGTNGQVLITVELSNQRIPIETHT